MIAPKAKLSLFLISNIGQMDDAQDEMQLNLKMSTTTTAGKSNPAPTREV